jgi:ATP-dependent DNA helicase RecG
MEHGESSMTTTPAQIDLWMTVPSEHQRLEFKEAKTQFDYTKLCRYCVALGNEGGGVLLLGISDKPPRQVVGTQAVNDLVGMASKLFESLGFRVDIEEVVHPSGRVLVFHIPSRPTGTAFHINSQYWMRTGEELVTMSEDRLRVIFAEGQPEWGEEPASDVVPDSRVIELLDVKTFFELLKLPVPSTNEGILDRLVHEQLVESKSNGFRIRKLGAILLAKRLVDFPLEISRKAARVVVYDGNSKLKTKLDRTATKGYAVGFQLLVGFIMEQLPQNELIQDALRVEAKLVPEITIRELVANAFIHQDLTTHGTSPMIEIYSNRVEISNPGLPIVPLERFIDGYQSRNERLADIMRRLRICEERSSGIDKVVAAAEGYQLPAPDFRTGHNRTIVVLFGPRTFEEMDGSDRIRACYQHCVLRYVLSERMTNQTLRDRFQLDESKSVTVSQIIKSTIESNLIKLDKAAGSSKKMARYLPFWT